MNVKDRILELNHQHTNQDLKIEDLLITIITKYQLFEPCIYLAEDDEWVNVAMVSIEDENISQAMSIRKSEITMFGVFNRDEIDLSIPKTDSEAFYQ